MLVTGDAENEIDRQSHAPQPQQADCRQLIFEASILNSVDPRFDPIESIVGPAFPHRLHVLTVADNKLRDEGQMQQKCNEFWAGRREPMKSSEAQDETRTRDPFLTMEVLYQLSYLGRAPILDR